MFTGLIETMGTIVSARSGGRSVELCVRADAGGYGVVVGGSVAVDGVCLTVERIGSDGRMYFTAVAETLRRTTLDGVTVGRRVNLERATRADGRLDGHIVLGHVDGTGRIVNDIRDGVSLIRTIELPGDIMVYMAEKGSITIDGISLTIMNVKSNTISISLIPATIDNTTMSLKKIGDSVNIECDVLARYIYRMLKMDTSHNRSSSGEPLIDKMTRLGF